MLPRKHNMLKKKKIEMESMNKWIYHESEYLESSSNKKELLTALFESSVISTLIFAITYIYTQK